MLTTSQFKEAVHKQKKAGVELGEVLIQNGAVSDEQVTAVLAAEWGCRCFPFRSIWRKANSIPSALIRLYSAIPLHYVAATKLLLVALSMASSIASSTPLSRSRMQDATLLRNAQ